MEQGKPRVNYADWVATQRSEQPKEGSIACLIERFINEMNGWSGKAPVRELGDSHYWILRRMQAEAIGQKVATKLTEDDVIAHCQWRRETVCAATVNQDITYLSGVLKYASSAPAWRKDYPGVKASPVIDAMPFLKRHGMIGKSTPRDRRPALEELDALLEHFRKQKQHPRTRIDMERMTLWQWYSAMRVGNSCEILWEDWNRAEQTILVRKMKDPKRRNKAKVVALTNQAQQFLIALETIRDQGEPRIHPYRKASVSKSYTDAKKALGIDGLRLHDSRRDRGTRLVEDDGCTSAQAICYTGHETVAVYERTYLRQDAAKVVRQVNERRAT